MSSEQCTICVERDCDVELSCQHTFCRNCLVEYIVEEVSNNEYRIKCPSNRCTDEIVYDCLKLILIDEDDTVTRLDRNIIRNQEREEMFRDQDIEIEEDDVVDVDVKRCPYCKYMVYKENGCDAVKCPNCKHRFCFNCLEMFRFMESIKNHEKKCDAFNGFNDEDNEDSE